MEKETREKEICYGTISINLIKVFAQNYEGK